MIKGAAHVAFIAVNTDIQACRITTRLAGFRLATRSRATRPPRNHLKSDASWLEEKERIREILSEADDGVSSRRMAGAPRTGSAPVIAR